MNPAIPLLHSPPRVAVAASVLTSFVMSIAWSQGGRAVPVDSMHARPLDVQPLSVANPWAQYAAVTGTSPKPVVVPRAPICQDIVAKIVSGGRAPEGSLASLSQAREPACVVRVGSHFGGREVVAIGYDRGRMSPSVLLSGKSGVCQAMTFERAEPKSANRTQSRYPSRRTAQSDHTEVLIERSAVDAIFERALELTQGLRVAPDVRNGAVTGMRLFGVRPDSLPAKLGFQNGDTIERVNGVALNSPEAALSLYATARALQRFDVDVNRAGKQARIEIQVN